MSENNTKSQRSSLVAGAMASTGEVSVLIHANLKLSYQHIMTAAQSARLAKEIELKYSDRFSVPISDSTREENDFLQGLTFWHRGYVNTSIVFAATAVGGAINEYLVEYSKSNQDQEKIQTKVDKLLKRGTTKEKYKYARKMLGITADESKSRPEHLDVLFKLRNELMHPEPQRVLLYPGPEQDLPSERLNKTVEFLWNELNVEKYPNPALKAGPQYLKLYKCLNYRCAKWAVETATNYVDEFFSQVESKTDGAYKSPFRDYARFIKFSHYQEDETE